MVDLNEMMLSRRRFMASILAAAVGTRLAPASPSLSVVDELMARIPVWMAEAKVPGCSVAWIQNARVVWSQGFGLKVAGEDDRVDAQTVFEAASLTKPMVAYLALKLVETGKLDLDARAGTLLDDPITDENVDRLEQITVRHLLSHSSGFPNWRPQGRALRVHHDPGTRFRYSGEGFMVLQQIIEAIGGQPLSRYANDHLIAPFALESASFVWREDYATRMAGGHDPSRNINGTRMQYTTGKAAGTLVCTTADYAQFVCTILDPPAVDACHLNGASLDLMFTPQINVSDRIDWGLGWGLQTNADGLSFWHWGNQNEVYHNFVIANRTEKSGIVVFTNARNGPQVYGPAVRAAMGGDQPGLDWVGA